MDKTTVEKLLTTTRSVRKRLDLSRPVPLDVIERCLNLAIQAPTGSNAQGWRFLVVTDPEKRQTIADYYAKSFRVYAAESAATAPKRSADDPRSQRMGKVVDSATYLCQKLAQVPVLIFGCLEGRVETESVMIQASYYGSILPAAWSLMLALRAEGLGTTWTTLHLRYEKEIGELLGIPETFTQTVLFPVAYFQGDDFQPAKRVPVRQLTYLDSWGQELP
jgi:nitroreductase